MPSTESRRAGAPPCARANDRGAHANERGVALLVTMITLILLALAVAAIMMLLHAETKTAGHDLRGSQALNLAEAGLSEAMARIRSGDVPDNGNARMIT